MITLVHIAPEWLEKVYDKPQCFRQYVPNLSSSSSGGGGEGAAEGEAKEIRTRIEKVANFFCGKNFFICSLVQLASCIKVLFESPCVSLFNAETVESPRAHHVIHVLSGAMALYHTHSRAGAQVRST